MHTSASSHSNRGHRLAVQITIKGLRQVYLSQVLFVIYSAWNARTTWLKTKLCYTADYKRSARMIEEPECKFTCNSGSFVIRIERDSACGLTAGQDTALRSSGTHLHRPPIPSCKSEASCSVRSGTEEFYCIL